jgi:cobalt transporter subunit CbtA
MLRNLLIAAGAAGLFAALALTLMQALWVTPLILQAEGYEQPEPAPAAHAHTHQHAAGAADHHHHHSAEWKPDDGWERTLFTAAANIAMGFGYALLLTALYTLWRKPANTAQGLLYGLAGFTVFFAAPGLGLPPELPGTAAAELSARQLWWSATAIATAGALGLLFMQTRWWLRALGALLLIAPHWLGAPHPAVASSLAPEDLQNQFRLLTVVCNALFWLLLGAVSTLVLQKLAAPKVPLGA